MTVSRDSAAYQAIADSDQGPHASLRLWLRLLACSSQVEGEVRKRLRDEFECTLPRFDVLNQLENASREQIDGLTMSDLSRRLMVTNGNLTALVERLVQEGMVSREASPSDRRTQVVKLSLEGRRALALMSPQHEMWINGMFAGLDDEDRSVLYGLLGKLRGSITTSLGEAPTD
jgi:DNA-binding MarR family transcriptional regulator